MTDQANEPTNIELFTKSRLDSIHDSVDDLWRLAAEALRQQDPESFSKADSAVMSGKARITSQVNVADFVEVVFYLSHEKKKTRTELIRIALEMPRGEIAH